MNYQENDDKNNAFDRMWREQFSTFSPMDKMTLQEAEKFKEYTRQVYTMGKEGKRSFYHW